MEKIEKLIAEVYKIWKSQQPEVNEPHPDEEALLSLFENKLSEEESLALKKHLFHCKRCMENLIIQIGIEENKNVNLPEELLICARNIVNNQISACLEIIFKLKGNLLELINTTGDVLVGQELIPSPVLRSRKIKDFKEEVVVLKDFENIRVEVKVENKKSGLVNLLVKILEKSTQQTVKDLRISLLKDDLELESYQADSGQAYFENIPLGKYIIDVSTKEKKVASIIFEIGK